MRHPPAVRRLSALPTGPGALFVAIAAACTAGVAPAADLPGDLLGRFTRGVQPLLVNKCGAGACHGGPTANEPRLRRPDVNGAIDRPGTLANVDAFLTMLGPDRDLQPLIGLLAVQHPRNPTSRRLVMKPLTTAERVTLDAWVRALHDAEQAVMPASHETPVQPDPPASRANRFRVLLDTGTPPPAARRPEPTGRTDHTAIIDKRRARPAAAAAEADGIRPESVPPAPLRETDDSPPARPDAPASPRPTSTGSR